MTTTKVPLYHVKQMRQYEAFALTALGLSEDELMKRAGYAAFDAIKQKYPKAKKIAIFCGGGNNAGDGYVLARLAYEAGYSVIIHQYKSPKQLPPTACVTALAAAQVGVHTQALNHPIDSDTDVVVDALLGIGLQGQVKGPIEKAITQINASSCPVLSLDTPSGLNVDTGETLGACVKADVTLTFIGLKFGFYTSNGLQQVGDVICNTLGLPEEQLTIPPIAYLLNDAFGFHLPKRLKNSHKGNFGHVLIVGGNYGMPGSVALSAYAALRTGAGVVTVATRPHHAQALPFLPEAMIYGVEQASQLIKLIDKATVIIIGPGLGEDNWSHDLFNQIMAASLPLVVDASALHCLAQTSHRRDNWILTPHPGEAASLLHCSRQAIQSDRYQAAKMLQNQYGGNIVLKGAGSIVCSDQQDLYVCPLGNPGMSTAGMGDVLSGVIAGLVAQGCPYDEAARCGTLIHARAGDAAASVGERGLLASDVMPYLRQYVNQQASHE